MNSFLGIISEADNEKIDFLSVKLEEIKKASKLIKGYLLEFCFSGDLYGKTLLKTLKTYAPSFQTLHNDPTALNIKINETVSFHESIAKALISVFLDYPSFLNTKMDDFNEKLNQSKKKMLDLTTVALKNFTNSKAQFYKTKLKYEKACKESEQSIQAFKKTQTDTNTMYNQNLLNKLDLKAKAMIKEAISLENNLKEAKNDAEKKLEKWNKSLVEGYQILISVYRSSYERLIEALDKYNANYTLFIGGCMKQLKERQNIELQNPLMLINEDDENLFVEELKFKDIENAANKGLYSELNARILVQKDNLKDQEINIYPDLAQKHLETYMILVDERRKIYKNLKNLLTEISQMVESFTKSLQKNSKSSSISNLGLSSPYYKRLNTFFETFSTTYDSIGKKLANLGLFMGIKVSTLENILKEHKNYEKSLFATVTRIIKDINSTKQNLAKGIQNHEKFVFSMGEAEKMKNELKYLQNKREAEECNESNKEILSLLRKMIYDASNVFSTAYKEFRNHEQLNLHSIKMILEGVNNQFMLSLEEIQETVKLSSDFFQKKFELDNEIKILISLDSALTNYENLGENGKIEEEEFAYEPFIVPIEYASINANNNNNNNSTNKLEINDKKSETNESNIEDNDKFSEKSLEKANTVEEDPVLVKKEQNSEESLDKTIERNSNNNNNSIIVTDSSKETSEIPKENSNSFANNSSNIVNNSNNINNNNNNNMTPMKELRDSRENSFIKDSTLKAIEKTQSSKTEAETSTEEWKSLESRFNLSAQDKFITSYACAFAQKILLQGRLYVFNTRLCFHSYFNAQTLFGNTKLNIPIDDIIRFEKRTNALFFNNAIAVITKNGELFFASFMSRDATFDALSKLLPQNTIKNGQTIPLKLDYLSDSKKTDVLNTTDQEMDAPNVLLPKKEVEEVISDCKNPRKSKRKSNNAEQLHKLSLNLTTDPKPQQVLLFQERKQRLEKLLIPIKNYKETVSHTFNDANLKDLLLSLFSLKSDDFQVIKHKGNNYCNFFELFLHENKEENVNIGSWDPIPPKYFRFMDNFDFEELLNYSDFSTMEISFQHPIKERVIFAPKFSHCNDKYQIFWISYEEIVIQVSTHFSKIPFGDYFIVRKAYFFKENKEKNQVEMTVRFYVDMVKSTVFQSRIEKSTAEETKEFYLEVFIPMALKTHKEYMHRVKDKYGNDSLSSRVLVMKKIRKSTKEVVASEQIVGLNSNKEKESAFLVPKEIAGSNQKVDFIADNKESREIKEQIREINEKFSEFMKDAERERKLLVSELQMMKNLMIGIIIFAFLITMKGFF